jgi:hypothetical protein
MSKTLYFAKVNINSESIYKIYRTEVNVDDIMSKLAAKIQNKIKHIHTIEQIVKGETLITKQEFSFTGINKLEINSELMIVGGIVKTAKIFVNSINKTTGEITTIPIDSDEIVNFCFYPKEEIVAYYCPRRFGYQTFIYAFQGLINKAFNEEHFNVSTITNGVSLDNIKESLKKIKNIKTLQIDIIPPNPNGDLRRSLRENAENKIKSFELGRITERSTIFKSSYKDGLDTDSEEISKELDDVTAIHSKLSMEEATKNGYVNVVATNGRGTIYNTNTQKVVKHRMPDHIAGDHNFAKFCKSIIEKVL